MPRFALWQARSVVVLAALLVYANTLGHGFVFDDNVQIVGNPWLASLAHLREIFTDDIWGFVRDDSHYYRPLMHVVFALTRIAFGAGSLAFHAVVVVLHGLTSLAVLELGRALLLRPRTPAPPRRLPSGEPLVAATAAGLLFAVHPIHTEAVAWVSGLPDVGCALLFLTSLLVYLRAQAGLAPVGLRHAAGAILALCAALFKEPGTTLPLVVLLCDLAARPRGLPARRWLGRYASLAASLAVYLALRANALGGLFGTAASGPFAAWPLVEASGIALWRYLAMVVWPHPLNAYQTLATAPALPPLLAVIVVAAALAGGLWLRSVAGTCAVALFLAPLLPTMLVAGAILSIGVPWAERYTYLPSAGAAIAIALAVRAAEDRSSWTRWTARGSLLVLLALGATLTVRRNAVWHDDLALWSDTARKSPGSAAVEEGLGSALLRSGRADQAVAHLRLGLELDPSRIEARHNLGIALMAYGRPADAEREFVETIRRDPKRALTYAALAMCQSTLGKHQMAELAAREAVQLAPDSFQGWQALGIVLSRTGRLDEAREALTTALRLRPGDPLTRQVLNRILARAP